MKGKKLNQIIKIQIAGASAMQCEQIKEQIRDVIRGYGFRTTVENFEPDQVDEVEPGHATVKIHGG